jgi:glycosyltransferase involved in cell wall biosynthesis
MIGQAVRRRAIPLVCHHRWVFGGEAIDWLNKFGAERHLFVSRALMEQLCSASNRLAACNRAVVYDGLPLPAVPTDADVLAARANVGLPLDKVIVLFAGQIIERKGVEDLLRAWRELPTTLSKQAELVFVGDDLENAGQYRHKMESLAAQLHCGALFVGFQRNVANWLTAADMCVVPSHVEPLGNATLEAMAHARLVVGTSVGGIPEMILDGETGLLVPPHDPSKLAAAIGRLLRDAALRTRLGQAGRKRCEERFSIRAHVDAVAEHYRSLLNRTEAVTA